MGLRNLGEERLVVAASKSTLVVEDDHDAQGLSLVLEEIQQGLVVTGLEELVVHLLRLVKRLFVIESKSWPSNKH